MEVEPEIKAEPSGTSGTRVENISSKGKHSDSLSKFDRIVTADELKNNLAAIKLIINHKDLLESEIVELRSELSITKEKLDHLRTKSADTTVSMVKYQERLRCLKNLSLRESLFLCVFGAALGGSINFITTKEWLTAILLLAIGTFGCLATMFFGPKDKVVSEEVD